MKRPQVRRLFKESLKVGLKKVGFSSWRVFRRFINARPKLSLKKRTKALEHYLKLNAEEAENASQGNKQKSL